jgi:hypothetical protein
MMMINTRGMLLSGQSVHPIALRDYWDGDGFPQAHDASSFILGAAMDIVDAEYAEEDARKAEESERSKEEFMLAIRLQESDAQGTRESARSAAWQMKMEEAAEEEAAEEAAEELPPRMSAPDSRPACPPSATSESKRGRKPAAALPSADQQLTIERYSIRQVLDYDRESDAVLVQWEDDSRSWEDRAQTQSDVGEEG